jgi:predicted O-linked N-acetylglucosamine transferase (SPINDLY family)
MMACSMPELSAQDGDDYVRIAVELAADSARLAALRNAMRARMQASPLMDVTGFTRQLEQCLMDLCRGNSLTLAGQDGSPRPAASR